ncbi:hypothetical protein ADIARSV_1944 [Arcticibacter svalbardensis MN12-7]|uniref:Uncharacterized protein n=2 Tax=Arcticibacter TaxID=1288026 RepID=R9GSP0_9SPHI|nr:hypothetical protein ADIARSV_1944 [Arcticibacter svalbardensis MN12-7]
MLDIKDSKAAFVMELFSSLPFVKVKPLSDEKAVLVNEIREAVEDLKLVRQGTLKACPARDLINEL